MDVQPCRAERSRVGSKADAPCACARFEWAAAAVSVAGRPARFKTSRLVDRGIVAHPGKNPFHPCACASVG